MEIQTTTQMVTYVTLTLSEDEIRDLLIEPEPLLEKLASAINGKERFEREAKRQPVETFCSK